MVLISSALVLGLVVSESQARPIVHSRGFLGLCVVLSGSNRCPEALVLVLVVLVLANSFVFFWV